MECRFKGLLHCEEFALIAAAVVALALARHCAHEVGVYVIGIAQRIGRHVDVVGIVAAFLCALDIDNSDVAHFVAGGVDVVARNPRLAAIVYARHEVPDVFFFFLDAQGGFFGVGDALFVDNLAPVALLHFHLILHARVVLHLGNLCRADKAFLKVRAATKHCGVIGRGVILAANCWKSKQQGEFALLCPFAAKAVRARLSAHKRSEVAEWVGFVEERHALYFVCAGRTVLPISIIYIWYMPTAVCPPEPHVARFLMHDAVNLRAVLGENNHAHGEKVVLDVRNLFEEKRV